MNFAATLKSQQSSSPLSSKTSSRGSFHKQHPSQDSDELSSLSTHAQAQTASLRLRQTAYQKTRLAYGVTGIGLIMICTWGALWQHHYLEVSQWLCAIDSELLRPMIAAILIGSVCALIQAPIDYMAYETDRIHGQITTHVRQFLVSYWAGLLRWLIELSIAALVIAATYNYFPENWAAVLCLLSGVLILFQQLMIPPAYVAATEKVSDAWLDDVKCKLEGRGLSLPEIVWVDHGERTLNGGWHGLFKSKLYLTKSLTDLPTSQAAVLIARELGHRAYHHRIWSMLATWFWLTLVILTSSFIASQMTLSLDTTDLVILTALVGTQFYFAGLFIWPALGRRQVMQANLYPLICGFKTEETLQAMFTLSDRNLPDESLTDVKAYVFHPIPTMSARRAYIARHAERLNGE